MYRSRRLLHSETLRRQQCKAARKKKLAAIGPRLEILQNMPFVIPFATRVQIFRQFVYQDQLRRRGGQVDPDHWRMSIGRAASNTRDLLSRHHAKISRNQVFEDAFEQFYRLGDGLKEPIQITFVDKFGATEAGIDGGGVTKEFLTSITNEAFRSEGGLNLFVTNDQNLLYPNPSALDEKRELLQVSGIEELSSEWRETMLDLLRRYEFLGRIIGKCLYEGILVDIAFAGFFLLKWSSTDAADSSLQDSRYLANINDLRDLDESLYQGLLQLKNYPGDASDFSLDFTISDSISMPGEPTRIITRNLLPNGSNTPVTNENRVLYISGVARHRLQVQPYQQTRAFLRGLGEIINPSWLSMFNQTELQTLIGGDSSEIDVDDLRQNTLYSGVYEIGNDGIEHPTIQIFWQVMKTLDDSDRRKVLKYVTSTPRAPLLGFAQLNPRFSIRDAGSDQQRLPSTSTCINLLKLPRYQSATTLRHKLLYAVNSGAGFDLS
jgi:ubiquitin-protein ligase E3 C